MGILKMAWRNIGRNRRRTAVTVGAMTLGLFAMVVYMAMMEGMLNDMEETIVEIDLGDLQIHAPTYLDDPSLYTVVDDVDALLGGLDAAGFRASARLVGAGLAAAHDSAAGASLRGVNVEDDARVSVIPTRLAEGAWLDDGDPFGVVVGRRLARSLNLALGDELVVLSQATDGGIANDLYTVRGILGTVSDGVDRSAVFLTEGAFTSSSSCRRGRTRSWCASRTSSIWTRRWKRRSAWPPASTRGRGGRWCRPSRPTSTRPARRWASSPPSSTSSSPSSS